MTHTVAILGMRAEHQDSECLYDLEVEITDSRLLSSASYTNPEDYSAASIDTITYKGVDVRGFVLSMIDENEILEAIENGTLEVESHNLRSSIAA